MSESYSSSTLCHFVCVTYLTSSYFFFFFFNDTATTEIYTLSLHDALPIYRASDGVCRAGRGAAVRRRLRAPQRLLRTGLPARARRPVGEGQELRQLRPARALPRYAGRDPRRARPAPEAQGERRDPAVRSED